MFKPQKEKEKNKIKRERLNQNKKIIKFNGILTSLRI